MAKAKKGPRQTFGLKCTVCGNFGYVTERNKLNTPEKLQLHKYCSVCRKATMHKEASKLK